MCVSMSVCMDTQIHKVVGELLITCHTRSARGFCDRRKFISDTPSNPESDGDEEGGSEDVWRKAVIKRF